MGIKFHCPNGHKLNVKRFLGGQRAICPKCGVSLVVPLPDDAEGPKSEATDPGAQSLDATAMQIDALKRMPEASTAAASAPPVENGGDVIGESPDANWYVRPATGGQFGPATGETMRAWVTEGRVSASSLVWRDGWPEWRAGAAVFPELAGLSAATPTPPPIGPAVSQTSSGATTVADGPPPIGGVMPMGRVVQNTPPESNAAGLSGTELPLSQSIKRQRRQRDIRLYTTAVLVVTSVILLIVLIVVFQRQAQPPEPPTQEADPSAELSIE